MKKKLRIVFLGTPDFAVASLEALLKNAYNIVAVITATDKKAGRGRKIHYSDVKNFAIDNNLKLLQPNNLKDKDFLKQLSLLNANLQVVVAFRMLPEFVWQMPEFGTINLHGSILPQYRGAAPINHAIINGEKETGVTTFFLNKTIDTGKIIMSEKTKIEKNDNFESLHDKLKIIGSRLIVKTVKLIEDGKVNVTEQNKLFSDSNELKSASKIDKEFCRIKWNNTSERNYNFIRGLSPYPAAFSFLSLPDNKKIQIKIFAAKEEKSNIKLIPGIIYTDNNNYLKISCTNGYLNILELQLAGKKRMDIVSFLRGFQIPENCKIL
jgi:methionyl-tRNA formyltransferase